MPMLDPDMPTDELNQLMGGHLEWNELFATRVGIRVANAAAISALTEEGVVEKVGLHIGFKIITFGAECTPRQLAGLALTAAANALKGEA